MPNAAACLGAGAWTPRCSNGGLAQRPASLPARWAIWKASRLCKTKGGFDRGGTVIHGLWHDMDVCASVA